MKSAAPVLALAAVAVLPFVVVIVSALWWLFVPLALASAAGYALDRAGY